MGKMPILTGTRDGIDEALIQICSDGTLDPDFRAMSRSTCYEEDMNIFIECLANFEHMFRKRDWPHVKAVSRKLFDFGTTPYFAGQCVTSMLNGRSRDYDTLQMIAKSKKICPLDRAIHYFEGEEGSNRVVRLDEAYGLDFKVSFNEDNPARFSTNPFEFYRQVFLTPEKSVNSPEKMLLANLEIGFITTEEFSKVAG